ncbi:OVARIAN TUMOR DOMAIN-containing deubiquitinating enzyme 1 isoform X1 [Physcomitrium patens]|uniref:Ubiquitin thioesterase n=1 Tax=Physcomitrium patens TaxID=3218 RepID=A0A2K1KI58_PHYPA|nr:ubiquitin thioesterase otubain-like isoform X1 [Physcomitrium patens]PNR53467.1 hypothetical protein PHYPA_007142 [Physcomitrium patens]|eukprot:XP_024376710.1 ubiquitin thioesterase otubain-like isoform X1 [Physcomitrella patens]
MNVTENVTEPGGEQDRPRDDEIQAFHNRIRAADADKLELVGDKEPLSVLEEEYKAGSPVFLAKLLILKQSYGAIRRARGDGNCFFRSFMFSYLEHLLVIQDEAEVARMEKAIEICKKTLIDLGQAEFTFEDYLAIFVEQLHGVIQGKETSTSLETLVERCRDQYVSNCVVMFFRFVTSGEIRRRSEFFEPFIQGMSNMSVVQFCRSCVEPMGEESDHVHIIALSDALGVPVRVVYLDQSGDMNDKPVTVNKHDFIPEGMNTAVDPDVILLYRPGHYDILYRRGNSGNVKHTSLEESNVEHF